MIFCNTNTVLPSSPPPTLLVPQVTQYPGPARLRVSTSGYKRLIWQKLKLVGKMLNEFITEELLSIVEHSEAHSGKAYTSWVSHARK